MSRQGKGGSGKVARTGLALLVFEGMAIVVGKVAGAVGEMLVRVIWGH